MIYLGLKNLISHNHIIKDTEIRHFLCSLILLMIFSYYVLYLIFNILWALFYKVLLFSYYSLFHTESHYLIKVIDWSSRTSSNLTLYFSFFCIFWVLKFLLCYFFLLLFVCFAQCVLSVLCHYPHFTFIFHICCIFMPFYIINYNIFIHFLLSCCKFCSIFVVFFFNIIPTSISFGYTKFYCINHIRYDICDFNPNRRKKCISQIRFLISVY